MHANYHAFTEQLVATLTGDSRVLGLVALGSMAEQGGRKPDRSPTTTSSCSHRMPRR